MSRRHEIIQNEIDKNNCWVNGHEMSPKQLKNRFFNLFFNPFINSMLIIKTVDNKKGYLARREKYELSIEYEIKVIK